jgi:general secretion pathway protein E
VEFGASDIHLERFERETHLRMRVDGILHDQPAPAANLYDALLTRIKIMAGLDIAERRRAQDGRVRMRLRGRNVDMRVSIVPTMYGQDAAIRLQDREKLATVSLSELGFADAQIDALYATAAKSHGILLITGPTGSGKTTTLYAILRQLASTERKVMTVEDPVEYAMAGVNQVPVNPAINLTFANTLRHLLRHDPDVILVGEIRDAETAQMAFQASLTGHMVLSTLHTNDVPSSFVRLVDMGVEPYLVNAAVEGVSAQRLLRTLDRAASAKAGEPVYRGRVAVMEFSPVTPAVKRCMLDGAEEQSIRRELMGEGFEPMRVAAERLVERGVTDRAEVARVLGAGPMAKVDAIAAAGAAAPRRDAPAPGDTAPAGGDA